MGRSYLLISNQLYLSKSTLQRLLFSPNTLSFPLNINHSQISSKLSAANNFLLILPKTSLPTHKASIRQPLAPCHEKVVYLTFPLFDSCANLLAQPSRCQVSTQSTLTMTSVENGRVSGRKETSWIRSSAARCFRNGITWTITASLMRSGSATRVAQE